MANPKFPDIQTPFYAYEEQLEDPGLASDTDDGTVLSRALFTRSRTKFRLTWKAMPNADKITLAKFYREIAKGTALKVDWTHPDPGSEFYGKSLEVRMTAISFSKVGPSIWAVELTLTEA